MIMRMLFATLMLTLLASTPSGADSTRPPGPEPRQIAEQAMKLIAADDMKGFIAMVRAKMPMPKGEVEKIEEMLKTQRKDLGATLGRGLGYMLLDECRRGDTLARLVYAEKREKNVLRWQFVFYKPRDTWEWTFFHWDADMQQLFAGCK